MKIRKDFVTNSSSSSFIFKNKTNETLNGRQFLEKLLAQVLEDAESSFEIGPGETQTIECSDDGFDKFELFIHTTFDNWASTRWAQGQEVEVKFLESHH